MRRVEGKVAIVTGAAQGIGRATAELLAREGAKVAITDIKDAEGEQVAEGIRKAGGDALFVHHDVTDESAWEAAVEATTDRFGRVDIVVNNAGIAKSCPPDEQTYEDWRKLMSINLDGVYLGTKHAMLAMKRNDPRPGGSIINLSSILGLVGDPLLGVYNASKGGVRLYTKSVALYCAKEKLNIRVNSVHPGYIWTPLVDTLVSEDGEADAGRKALDALHPIGHVGEPNDIAYGILYLASDESKFVTGSELVIDGGYTAQ